MIIQIPAQDWSQIVDDLENMCGTSEWDIEILKRVKYWTLNDGDDDELCERLS